MLFTNDLLVLPIIDFGISVLSEVEKVFLYDLSFQCAKHSGKGVKSQKTDNPKVTNHYIEFAVSLFDIW
jgi:hypothetical protein